MYRFNRAIIFLFCCIFLITAFSHDAYSQRQVEIRNIPHYDYRPYHFGFLLGVNKMDFALKPVDNLIELDYKELEDPINKFDNLYTVLPKHDFGFNIGIVSNLKLGKYFDLRFIPTLTFGDRTIVYEGIYNNDVLRDREQKIESTFLDFPLHLKYKSARINNTRVYVIGGIKYTYDLASGEDRYGDDDILARISRNDYYYELGIGFDHYFYYFKFSTELKASFGMNDILEREGTIYTNSIESLKSQIIQLSILFE